MQPVLKFAQSGGCLNLMCGFNNVFEFETLKDCGQQRIYVASGKTFCAVSDATAYDPIVIKSSLRIFGEGTYQARSKSGVNVGVTVAAGQTFEVACNLANVSAAPSGLRITGTGTFKSTGGNTIAGKVEMTGSTYEFASVAQLGVGTEICLASNGRLKYTGAGGTVQKTVKLNGHGVIEQAGTGEVVFTGVSKGTDDTYRLTLVNTTDEPIVFTGDVAANVALSAGNKVVFRKPDGAATAEIAVPSVALAGDATVEVADGVTMTFAAVTRTAGALDIVTSGNGVVRMPSVPAGFAPAWLTVNGHGGLVRADGSLVDRDAAADDTSIDAHGGVVPNAAGQTVGIATATGPAGQNVTLAADATEVLMLRQRQAVDPATVEIGAAQTLSAGAITVETGAKPLTLGTVVGQGAVAPSGDSLEFDVKDADGKITANAAVSVPAGKTLFKSGAGAVELKNGFAGAAEVRDGSLTVDGVGATSVTLAGAGAFTTKGSPAGDLYLMANSGRLSLSGTVNEGAILVASNSTAVLEMTGGVVTSKLSVACEQLTSRGAFYLTGGTFVNSGTGVNAGRYGLCYVKIAGGTFVGPKSDRTRIASAADEVMEMTGGRFTQEFVHGTWFDGLSIGNGWHRGVLRLTGGTMEMAGDIALPTVGDSGSGVVTIDGPDAQILFPYGRGIHMGMCNTSTYSNQQVLNLNAGRLRANYVDTWKSWSDPCQNKIVNFNGGIYQYLGNDSPFGKPGSDWNWPVDHVTVFEGGATIETASTLASSLVPFCAPTGKGVKSVNWTPVSGLAPGAQIVLISDEAKTGWGASAFAQVSDEGVLTNVVMMSAGCNYTGPVTASLRRPSGQWTHTTVATFGCTLGTFASGGFTKGGSGTLGFGVANTYTGPTVVKQGALRLDVDNAIAAASTLVLDGGDFDMNGKEQTFAGFDCRSGKVLNGTLAVSALTVDFNRVLDNDAPTFNSAYAGFTSGAQFTLVNYDATKLDPSRSYWVCRFVGGRPANLPTVAIDLPKGHRLSVSDAGIRISRDIGMAVIIR